MNKSCVNCSEELCLTGPCADQSLWTPKKDKVVVIGESQVNTRLSAILRIDTERNRQDAKWGEQNHTPQLWTGILGEEYGEYCQAVNETVFNNGPDAKLKGGYDNMMTELTHIAAVAVGAMESLMRAKNRGDL